MDSVGNLKGWMGELSSVYPPSADSHINPLAGSPVLTPPPPDSAYLLDRLATFSQGPCSLGCHFLTLLNYQEAYICLLFYKNLSKISHLLMSPFFVCLLLQICSLSIFNRSWDGASRRKWSLC